jgi:hypothetical protein
MDIKHKHRLVAAADDLDPVVVMLIERMGYQELLIDRPTDQAIEMVGYCYRMAYIMEAAKRRIRDDLEQGDEKA